jgi:ATP synthase delta (OSCP) subunit
MPSCILAQVQKLAQDSADFGRFIKDPTISREQKATALESISSQMKLSELTSRFIGAHQLSFTARLPQLPVPWTTTNAVRLYMCAANMQTSKHALLHTEAMHALSLPANWPRLDGI